MDGESTSQVAAPNSPEGQENGQAERPESQAAPAKQGKPNWYDDPKFREMQSKKDREIAEARQQALYAQQQLTQMQQRMRELEMRDMSTDEQLQYRLQEMQREAEQYKGAYFALQQQQQIEQEKRAALEELLGDGDYPNVTVSDLMDAKSATEAAKRAARLQRERSGATKREQEAQQEERRMANRTDMGGRPPAPRNERDERLEAARRSGDGTAFWNAQLESLGIVKRI